MRIAIFLLISLICSMTLHAQSTTSPPMSLTCIGKAAPCTGNVAVGMAKKGTGNECGHCLITENENVSLLCTTCITQVSSTGYTCDFQLPISTVSGRPKTSFYGFSGIIVYMLSALRHSDETNYLLCNYP